MYLSAMIRRLVLVCLVLVAAPAAAQATHPLVGTWVGACEDNEGERVVVGKNWILIDGERMPLSLPSPGVLVIGEPDERERMTYALSGDRLTITMDGDKLTWRRLGAPPKAGPGPRPVPGSVPPPGSESAEESAEETGNPLGGGRSAAADPFARRFAGDGMRLELRVKGPHVYHGAIVFKGNTYPAEAQARGHELRGVFTAAGRRFDFRARLDGDRLTLESGGKQYRLAGERRAAPPPSNPLADDAGRRDPGRPVTPARVTRNLVSREAGVAVNLPNGWTRHQEAEGVCVVVPKVRSGERIEATVILTNQAVKAGLRGKAVDQLLAAELSDFRRDLADNGIQTRDPAGPPRVIRVDGRPAAMITLLGQTKQQQPARVWLAVRIEGDRVLVLVGMFLNGKESVYQPTVQRMFESLVPASAAASAPAAGPAPVRSGPRGAAGKPRTLSLTRKVVHDRGMNGIASHTVLVPKGWTFQGGVKWTMHPFTFVHFVGSLASPRGASTNFDLNRSFYYSNNPAMLRQKGAPMGGTTRDGTIMRVAPQRHGEVAVQVVIPRMRPGARNVRLVSARTMTEAKQKLEEYFAPLVRILEQGNRTDTMGFRQKTWVHAEEARVAYEENGREWEERISYSVVGTHSSIANEFMRSESGQWTLMGVRTERAPKGRLDAELPTLIALGGMIKQTPRWGVAINQLQMKLSKIRHEGRMAAMRQSMAAWRKRVATNNEISDMQMATWKKQQASSDRIQRMNTNSILDVNDYRTSDGRSIQIDQTYDRVYEDRAGNLLMTNDPAYEPSRDPNQVSKDWTQLKQVR